MDRPVNPLVDLLLTLAAAGVEVRGNRPFLLHRPRQLPLGLAERLDRHRSGANAVWDALQRGDAVRLSLPDADGSPSRIGADARVEVWTPDQGAAASAHARSQSS